MQFGSKIKRNIITNGILGLVPDALIAVVAAFATDSGILGFFAVLIGLQILYLLIWAKNAIWGWLLFWARGRKQLVAHLLDFMRANRFPEPEEYQDDVQDYLGKTISDEQQPVDVRLKAAAEVGSLNALRLTGQGSQFLKTNLAYEDAIQRYKRDFHRRTGDERMRDERVGTENKQEDDQAAEMANWVKAKCETRG